MPVVRQINPQQKSKRLKDYNCSGVKESGKQKDSKKEGSGKVHEKEKYKGKEDLDVEGTKKDKIMIQQRYYHTCSQMIELQKCEQLKENYRLLQ